MCERGLTSRMGDAVRVDEADKDAQKRVNEADAVRVEETEKDNAVDRVNEADKDAQMRVEQTDMQIVVDEDLFKQKLVNRYESVDQPVDRGPAQHSY